MRFTLFVLGAVMLANTTQAQEEKKQFNLNAADGIVYYDLETNQPVAKTNKGWDIAFNKTSIQLNSADGKVEGQIVSGNNFDKVTKAPASGYKKDGATSVIPGGSGNGWYNYNMDDHTIQPIADKVLVIKTTEGKYVKLAITSYYKDQKDFNPGGYYNFKYSFIK
jgi:hypothetical protein